MQHSNINSNSVTFKSKGIDIHVQQGRQDLLAMHQAKPERYPFLLESVAHTDKSNSSSRFDILFAFPQEILTLSSEEELSGINNIDGRNFLDNLSLWWERERNNTIQCDTFPFSGGWFIYLAYELAKQVEPHVNFKQTTTPIAYATRIPAAIIYDHKEDLTYCLCEAGIDHIKQLQSDCEQNNELTIAPFSTRKNIQEEDQKRYLDAVKKIKNYIVDGDIFQANLSRLWQIKDINLTAVELYKKLRETNPAPFAGLAVYQDFSIISSSPERLFSIKNGYIETRPIAGTRRREKDQAEDEKLKSELIANPKERAEHIMLIDLERNDLGRVCIPGSIKVDEFMILETFAHVHHIVSNISGKLKADILPGEIIKAVFPGGTITGCPKVRCMEILSEFENEARGAYTGSMGYLNHNGDMDMNILIRTMTLENNNLNFRAGAGLVADSLPQAELEETQHKAKGLLLALQ